MKLPLILIAGPPGTGKTTNAKHLEGCLNYERFDAIEARRQLGITEWSADQRAAVTELVTKGVRSAYLQNRGSIVEASFGALKARQNFYSIAEEENLEVVVLQHTCSEQTAKQRIRQRSPSSDLISDTTDPRVWDIVLKSWYGIENDLDNSAFLSLVIYDTDNLTFRDVRVNDTVASLIGYTKKVLASYGKTLQ